MYIEDKHKQHKSFDSRKYVEPTFASLLLTLFKNECVVLNFVYVNQISHEAHSDLACKRVPHVVSWKIYVRLASC